MPHAAITNFLPNNVLYASFSFQNDSYNRFKESFIKQFANIEHRRLSNAASAINTATADCLPLVAINSSGACTGSLDIRPNYTPEDPEAAAAAAPGPSAYVCNVVVAPNQRRAGIGRQLVEAAKGIAANQLGATYLYAHVESVNDAASELYSKCGFETVAVEGGVGGTTVGQRILLRCKLERES